MANHSKTTRKCTKCLDSRPYSQFGMTAGKLHTWCNECREAYDTERKAVSTGSKHTSMIKEVVYKKDAVMSKSWIKSRIQELKDAEANANCHLTKVTREFNEQIYINLFC